MFFIKTEFKETNQELLIDILKQIDKKIYVVSLSLLNNIRFGFSTKINRTAYRDLMIYKSIITDIMYCSDSVCDVNPTIVVSKVKKLINSIC